jgi:hypothetical protein
MNFRKPIFAAEFPRGAKVGLKNQTKAEIIPVEPEQGNSCEGKVCFFPLPLR